MWFSESIPVNIQTFNPDANLKKYVAFDLDYTLIKTKSGKKFPDNEDDWMWLNENVPKKLEKFHYDGYHVIVVSNQSSKKVECVANKVKQIFDKLSITATVFICYGNEYRKPNRRVINEHINSQLIEFYCGDACGRLGDFSNSDLLFAFNIGVKFVTPEDVFRDKNASPYTIPPPLQLCGKPIADNAEIFTDSYKIIMMCGYPASGKTRFAKRFPFKFVHSDKYIHIDQDSYKTLAKTRKAFLDNLGKRSIIVDNTFPDIVSRRYYIEKAQQAQIPIYCVHCATPINVAYYMNHIRCETNKDTPKMIPKVAYYAFRKKFEPPSCHEGFANVYEYIPSIESWIFEKYRYPLLDI